jgi:hypothetical protein
MVTCLVLRVGEADEPDLDPVGVGLHGHPLKDFQGLFQVHGARLGLAAAQEGWQASPRR